MEISPAQFSDFSLTEDKDALINRFNSARRALQLAGRDYADFYDSGARLDALETRGVRAGIFPHLFLDNPRMDSVARDQLLQEIAEARALHEAARDRAPFIQQAAHEYNLVEADAIEAGLIPPTPSIKYVNFTDDPHDWASDLIRQLAETGREMYRAGEDLVAFRAEAALYNQILDQAIPVEIIYVPIKEVGKESTNARVPGLEIRLLRQGLIGMLDRTRREILQAGVDLQALREAVRSTTIWETRAFQQGLLFHPNGEGDLKIEPTQLLSLNAFPGHNNLREELALARGAMERSANDPPILRQAALRYNRLMTILVQEWLVHQSRVATPTTYRQEENHDAKLHKASNGSSQYLREESSKERLKNPVAGATAKLTKIFEKQLLGHGTRARNLTRLAMRATWARTPLGKAVLATLQPLQAIAHSTPAASVLTSGVGATAEMIRRSLTVYAELRALHDRFRPIDVPRAQRDLAHGDFSNQSLSASIVQSRNPVPVAQPSTLEEAIRRSRSAEAALIKSHRGFVRGIVPASELRVSAELALSARAGLTATLHRSLEIPSYRDFTAVLGSGHGRALSAWAVTLQRAGLSARAVASSIAEVAPFAVRSIAKAVAMVGTRRLVNWVATQVRGGSP